MPAPFENFVRIANFFYTSIGIQPYQDERDHRTQRKSLLVNFVFYFLAVNLNSHLLGEIVYVYMAFYTGTNFLEAIVTASFIGFVAVADCKMISVWYMKNDLTALIGELRAIYPKTLEKQESYKLKPYLRHVTMVMVMFSSLYMLLIWTFNLFAILQYAIYKSLGVDSEQHLPYNVYSPVDWSHTGWFYVLSISQIMAGFTSAAGNISSDLLLCAIVTQVCMHFDYVTRRIESFSPSGDVGSIQFLNGMIEYHQKVISLTNRINSCFGVPLLFNFAASSFIICFVGFQITTGVTNEELFKYMLFLLSSLAQVYLICYYGQRIVSSSENIAAALYTQIWYKDASMPYKKSLIIMMRRAQKPAQLKATVFLPISARTFAEIGQLSYKFFALLRTMYAKK